MPLRESEEEQQEQQQHHHCQQSKNADQEALSIPKRKKGPAGSASAAAAAVVPPQEQFTPRDVAKLLGRRKVIAVSVKSQASNAAMTLDEWADYWEDKPSGVRAKRGVLNLISLEFSGTPLEGRVRSPSLVRQIDWVDRAWLSKQANAGSSRSSSSSSSSSSNSSSGNSSSSSRGSTMQLEHAHGRGSRKWGAQGAVLLPLSVAGSYTDFHVDFGALASGTTCSGAARFFFWRPRRRRT